MADVPLTIFSTPLAQTALVFVLVFTIVFAVLQKSKILGEGKKQIDALVALSIGLLVISVAYALKIISGLAPFLAVSLVIILVFLLLAGMVHIGKFELKPGWITLFTVLAFVAVILAVLFITDAFNSLQSFFGNNSSWLPSVILIVIVGIAIWVVSASGTGNNP